jgi:hypothetical protein
MSEPVQTIQPIGAEPVGWETDREWELEQRAFHCNENWAFEDVRQLVNDLWFQYCLAANPIRMEKETAAKDAEIAKLREALTSVRGSIKNARGAVESNQVVDKDVHGTLSRAIRMIDAALNQGASDA